MTWTEWVFIGISAVWISEFLLFRNRSSGNGEPLEKKTFHLIFAALGITIAVAMMLQEMTPFETVSAIMKVAGILIFAAGVFLRFWGILHLKAQFTRNVTVQEGDRIVSSGPYRKLRHPLYTGLFLIGIGMSLFFSSLAAAVIGGVAIGWALQKRMQFEEQLLVEQFGEEYVHWMKQRARLIPYVY